MLQQDIKSILPFDQIKTKNLVSNETGDLILISLAKNAILKEHSSPTDASVLILEGEIIFMINDKNYSMQKGDLFNFKSKEVHALEAIEDSKILLIK